MDFKPPFETIDDKICHNLGAGLDVCTGTYVKGLKGENILNGGMPGCVGIAGNGNTFKSAVAKFMAYTVYARFVTSPYNYAMNYDTEVNASITREMALSSQIDGLEDEHNPFFDPSNPRCFVTDKSIYTGDEWFAKFKDYVNERHKNASKLMVDTPFVDPKTGKTRKIMVPMSTLLDSLTEFETADVLAMKDDNDLGEKGANTLFMRSGLSKVRLIGELITLIPRGGINMVLTAHIGKHIPMDPNAPPLKTLQFLKNGDVIKGVTGKFFFLTHICWQTNSAVPMINQSTKAPEYPASSEDDMAGDTDLMRLTMTILRNKFGRTGLVLQLVVSQEQGVKVGLTDFDYIKTNDRFGFEGNDRNYNLVFLPDVKLSRTVVRKKIDEDAKLRRALNLLSEMCMQQLLWTDEEGIQCTPKELYDDLIAIGYDWDTLLDTRHYWLPDQYSPEHKPFLSTKDFLEMRVGKYVPYWWPKDKPLDMSKCKAPQVKNRRFE
jgi:hypothetical protein